MLVYGRVGNTNSDAPKFESAGLHKVLGPLEIYLHKGGSSLDRRKISPKQNRIFPKAESLKLRPIVNWNPKVLIEDIPSFVGIVGS